jgi:Asp/Glu/hydantoin racemase
MKRIVLVNPNTSADATSLMLAIARKHLTAGHSIEGLTAPVGTPLIVDADQLNVAAAAVATMAPILAPRADGVIVSAFGDPGADVLGVLLTVPVAGIAECAMREAAAGGRRFSIVTTTPRLVSAIRSCAERLGLHGQLAGICTTDGPMEALMADHAMLVAALDRAARVAVDRDGVEAVIIGGGPLAAAAECLGKRSSVPIVEPVPAAVRWMQTRLARRAG